MVVMVVVMVEEVGLNLIVPEIIVGCGSEGG